MDVPLARFVGDRRRKVAYPAGTREAMRIRAEYRVGFASTEMARRAGFRLP